MRQLIFIICIIPLMACQQSNSTTVAENSQINSDTANPAPQDLNITQKPLIHTNALATKPSEQTTAIETQAKIPTTQIISSSDTLNIRSSEQKITTSVKKDTHTENTTNPALTLASMTIDASKPALDACALLEHKPEASNSKLAIVTRGLMRNTNIQEISNNEINFTGIGRASNEPIADQGALEELLSNINDAVRQTPAVCSAPAKALLSVCQDTQYSRLTKDELPLLGVQYKRQREAHGTVTNATLSAESSLAKYREQLKNEHNSLLALFDKIQQKNIDMTDNKRKIGIHLRRYLGLSTVAAILGENQYSKNAEKLNPILNHIASYQTADSLNDAASKILAVVATRNLQVFPPRPYNALEVTPFGAELAKRLKKKLNTKSLNKTTAKQTLVGSYKICRNGDMLLNYDLIGKNYLVTDSVSLRINKTVYAKYRTQPLSEDFEQTFMQKTSAYDGFRSDITTNRGKQNLLFRDSESINFYARLNQPGYFFIVGHVLVPGKESFSYLLELDEDPGSEKYIFYVSPDQINQYIDLGEYEMGAPFGNEYLQLVASSKPPQLPSNNWNESIELAILEDSTNSIKKSVERVRAARKVKKSKQFKVHESLLAYTTMQ